MCLVCHVCFVLGNTGAEAFIKWVRGTKCVQCGDTACALFLTTDPLNVEGEHTTSTEHMGQPLHERPSVFWTGALEQQEG